MALYKRVGGQNVKMSAEEEAAIRAEWAAWDAKQAAEGYKEKRAGHYPSVADQLDAIWKQLQATPDLLIPEAKVMSDQVLKVKEDFPKPTLAQVK